MVFILRKMPSWCTVSPTADIGAEFWAHETLLTRISDRVHLGPCRSLSARHRMAVGGSGIMRDKPSGHAVRNWPRNRKKSFEPIGVPDPAGKRHAARFQFPYIPVRVTYFTAAEGIDGARVANLRAQSCRESPASASQSPTKCFCKRRERPLTIDRSFHKDELITAQDFAGVSLQRHFATTDGAITGGSRWTG